MNGFYPQFGGNPPNFYQDWLRIQQGQNQAPVQNYINTTAKVDLEARFLNDGEDVSNIIVSNRTLFIDEKNQFMAIKEVDGRISKQYQLIIPKDEKEQEIDNLKRQLEQSNLAYSNLTSKLQEMELKLNGYEYLKSDNASTESSAGDIINDTRPAKKTASK